MRKVALRMTLVAKSKVQLKGAKIFARERNFFNTMHLLTVGVFWIATLVESQVTSEAELILMSLLLVCCYRD